MMKLYEKKRNTVNTINTPNFMITKEIANYLKDKLGGYEIPPKVAFIEEDFTVENDLLTQTMKSKRRNILENNKDIIENLYTEANNM